MWGNAHFAAPNVAGVNAFCLSLHGNSRYDAVVNGAWWNPTELSRNSLMSAAAEPSRPRGICNLTWCWSPPQQICLNKTVKQLSPASVVRSHWTQSWTQPLIRNEDWIHCCDSHLNLPLSAPWKTIFWLNHLKMNWFMCRFARQYRPWNNH